MKIKSILSKIQKKLLDIVYLIKPKYFFYQSFDLFQNYAAKPKIIGLELNKNSLIGSRGELIFLPGDAHLTWHILKYGELNYPISDIIKTRLNKNQNYTFIDIGANVGLVSRQLNASNENIDLYFCIEPVKNTFECLEKNTENIENKYLFNFALGEENSIKDIYIDKSNHGNASLSESMMKFSKHNEFRSEKISIKSVKDFFASIKELLGDNHLIIKIDVQAYDELIFSLIPEDILEKTVLLNYELTNLDGVIKPMIDTELLKKNLSYFRECWSYEIDNLSMEQLIKFSEKHESQNVETDIYLLK